jgi:hypothetical protein
MYRYIYIYNIDIYRAAQETPDKRQMPPEVFRKFKAAFVTGNVALLSKSKSQSSRTTTTSCTGPDTKQGDDAAASSSSFEWSRTEVASLAHDYTHAQGVFQYLELGPVPRVRTNEVRQARLAAHSSKRGRCFATFHRTKRMTHKIHKDRTAQFGYIYIVIVI